MTTLKGFYDYTEDELRTTLPKDTYHLRVTGYETGFWDDGRERVDVQTEVASGPHAGKFGPRKTWSLGDSDGVTADGREFHVDGEDAAKGLIRDVNAITDGQRIALSNPGEYNMAMLEEIGKQLVGREFVANVSEDKNGYARMGRIYPMSAPPKTFKSADMATALRIDDI